MTANETTNITTLPAPERRKGGRPSIYSQDLAAKICGRIAGGEPLTVVCRDEDMPCHRTVMNWAFHTDLVQDDFLQMYRRARQLQADIWADEIVELAEEAVDGPSAQVARIKIDARKWACSKINPAKYGDRTTLEHQGAMKVENVPAKEQAPDWIKEQIEAKTKAH